MASIFYFVELTKTIAHTAVTIY